MCRNNAQKSCTEIKEFNIYIDGAYGFEFIWDVFGRQISPMGFYFLFVNDMYNAQKWQKYMIIGRNLFLFIL